MTFGGFSFPMFRMALSLPIPAIAMAQAMDPPIATAEVAPMKLAMAPTCMEPMGCDRV